MSQDKIIIIKGGTRWGSTIYCGGSRFRRPFVRRSPSLHPLIVRSNEGALPIYRTSFFLQGVCQSQIARCSNSQLRGGYPEAVLSPPELRLDILKELLSTYLHTDVARHIRYWRTVGGAEVDFIVDTDEGPLPVEVKFTASTPSEPVAMRNFRTNYPQARPGLIISRDVTHEDGALAVPAYLVDFLAVC